MLRKLALGMREVKQGLPIVETLKDMKKAQARSLSFSLSNLWQAYAQVMAPLDGMVIVTEVAVVATVAARQRTPAAPDGNVLEVTVPSVAPAAHVF